MSCPLRFQYPGTVYHLIARGTARQRIFLDEAEREAFLRILSQGVSRYGWLCHASCLMDNHYHLLTVQLRSGHDFFMIRVQHVPEVSHAEKVDHYAR